MQPAGIARPSDRRRIFLWRAHKRIAHTARRSPGHRPMDGRAGWNAAEGGYSFHQVDPRRAGIGMQGHDESVAPSILSLELRAHQRG